MIVRFRIQTIMFVVASVAFAMGLLRVVVWAYWKYAGFRDWAYTAYEDGLPWEVAFVVYSPPAAVFSAMTSVPLYLLFNLLREALHRLFRPLHRSFRRAQSKRDLERARVSLSLFARYLDARSRIPPPKRGA